MDRMDRVTASLRWTALVLAGSLVTLLAMLGLVGCGLAEPTGQVEVEPGAVGVVQSGDGPKSVTVVSPSAPPSVRQLTEEASR